MIFIRKRNAAAPGVGAMPAWDSRGAITTATVVGATHAVARPASLALGDYMKLVAMVRTSDATSISITRHADLIADGWAEAPESPVPFNGTFCEAAVFWKEADANDVANAGANIPGGITVSHNGSTSGDFFVGLIDRFTAANGFAATPHESADSSVGVGTGNISMNTVTPTGINRLGVTYVLMTQDNQAVSPATGETGGNWVEEIEDEGMGGLEVTVQLQTADLSAGDAISGGESTHASSAAWAVWSAALVPSGG
jgi:hypothetical protein